MSREISNASAEVRCACGRLLARIVTADTGMHYELRRRGKPVAVVTSGELHCVCGKSVRVGQHAIESDDGISVPSRTRTV